MNFLLLEAVGKLIVFRGGELDGRTFCSGETVFVNGKSLGFELVNISRDDIYGINPYGIWCLERRVFRSRPAVCCRYFNKRSSQVEQRYLKIFNSDGYYYCGPRFPRKVREVEIGSNLLKEAA